MAAGNCKATALFGPFTERLPSAQNRPTSSTNGHTTQPPVPQGAHASQNPLQHKNTTSSQQTPHHYQILPDSSDAVSDKLQQRHVRHISNPSNSRPAFKQAASSIAAAEAALSAAADVLKTASQLQQQQLPRQMVQTSGASCQQQQRLQHGQKPAMASPGSGLRQAPDTPSAARAVIAQDAGSSHQPQPNEQETSASYRESLAPLQVQGRKAARQQQHHSSESTSRQQPAAQVKEDEAGEPGCAARLPGVTATQSPGVKASQESTHHCHQMADRQLLQCSNTAASSVQQSPAMTAALQAVHKRLRIQQRSRQGPTAYQRSPLQRLGTPKPVQLTGTLILDSCPDAATPADVLFADLSSADIKSIDMPTVAATDMSAADVVINTADEQAGMAGASTSRGVSLSEFTNLCVLDLSDNMLSCIAGLSWLPALWQLAVPANRLRTLQSLSQVLQHHKLQYSAEAVKEADFAATFSQGKTPPEELAAAIAAEASSLAAFTLQLTAGVYQTPKSGAFSQLQVLDVSYNMLTADDLLGKISPLAQMPRLSELLAAGNSLSTLPADLGAFTSLTHLDLAHNRLTGAALTPLGQLPALSQLLLSHNPIKSAPISNLCTAHQVSDTVAPEASPHFTDSSSGTTATAAPGACSSYKELTWLDLSHSHVRDAQKLVELLQLPKLCVLQLVGCPVTDQRWSGRDPVQVLRHDGLTIITHQQERLALWQHNPKHRTKHLRQQHATSDSSNSSMSRLLPVTVENDAPASIALVSAGKNAILGLQHEQLVAAFQRVGEDIDNWRLPPVVEEDSAALLLAAEAHERQQQNNPEKVASVDDEPIVDQTFLTGVGITGELPDGNDEAPVAGKDDFQDPTERLALALGLQVTQLAHHTHKSPGNPVGPVHKLRHAFTHPMVDPEAGQRPQQHHASMTAATAVKQRPRQLLPLPQPISTAMSTQVVAIEGIDGVLQSMRGRLQILEGSVLQQLQAQADKLSAASHHLTQNATGGVTFISAANSQC